MVKLGFSVVFFALFTFLPAVFAASLRRQSGLDLLNVTSTTHTNSSGLASCDALCDEPQTVLKNSCVGVTTLSLVPCGCTDAYSTAQEACSRCRLPFSGDSETLGNNLFNERHNFAGFQQACAAAGKPIKDIDLDNIDLAILRPINFTFETPLSMYDESFPDYINALCMRPDQITLAQCSVGGYNFVRCPNGDVAGILVRFAAYMANLLLGIVLMYSPEESATAVWTQVLTVYSLLISGIIAIGNANLSRFHSGMTIFLVMSPLSTSLIVYAILGFCGRAHRLDNILSGRREHLFPRLLVIAYGVISLAILIYTGSADGSHFSSNPCESDDAYRTLAGIIINFLWIPYAGVIVVFMVIQAAGAEANAMFAGIEFLAISPFVLILVSTIYGIVKQRHLLAKQFRIQSDRWKIWVAWDVLAAQYPFMHFCGVFFVPMLYWIMVNEIRTLGTPDNIFSSSFGQILALFVILPPLWQVIQMAPRARRWFMNLTMVRLITRRPQDTSLQRIYSLEDGVSEKDTATV
ncbi:hypothetical protein MVEN_01843400 [Mycena venus]|uniref:Uncharacterized protein n=1 Tax=Mycena venus TaxID=2733690 RepID=A0A8H6XIG3_9AGAR|nr:hypothetical protein MVEN_01843400 [Mycena venus]